MNDWTAHFKRDNFGLIKQLYTVNGFSDRVDYMYWPTAHCYDKPKRERTYWWMEKWLRNREIPQSGTEPNDIKVFEPSELQALTAKVASAKNGEEKRLSAQTSQRRNPRSSNYYLF